MGDNGRIFTTPSQVKWLALAYIVNAVSLNPI